MTIGKKLNTKIDNSQLITYLLLIKQLIRCSNRSCPLLISPEDSMDLLKAIGRKIQFVREKKGLTQEQLEELTGVNTKYISAIERGQKNVTVKTLEKIVKGLDIEIYELFLSPKDLASEKAAKKAIESLLKDADMKTLNLCLDFLRKTKA